MRFQFSILTMLVCTAVLAAVSAAAGRIDVYERIPKPPPTMSFHSPDGDGMMDISRTPTATEIAWRMAWAGPLAGFFSLCLLWASRRIVNSMRGRA